MTTQLFSKSDLNVMQELPGDASVIDQTQLDAQLLSKLSLDGTTVMSGALNMGSQ